MSLLHPKGAVEHSDTKIRRICFQIFTLFLKQWRVHGTNCFPLVQADICMLFQESMNRWLISFGTS